MPLAEFKEFGKIARLNRDVVITEKLDGTNAQVLFEPFLIDPPHEGERGGNVPVGDEIATVKTADGVAYGVYAGSRNRWVQPGKTSDNYGFAGWVQANAPELLTLLGPGRHFGEWWGGGVQRKYGLGAKRFSLFNVSRYGKSDEVRDPRCLKGFVQAEGDYMASTPVVEHKFHEGRKVCACRPAQEAVKADIGGVLVEPVPVIYRGPWFIEAGEKQNFVTGSLCREEPGDPGVSRTKIVHSDPCNCTPGHLFRDRQWGPDRALDVLRRNGSLAAPGFMDPEGVVVFHEASGQLFKATIKGDEKPKGAA